MLICTCDLSGRSYEALSFKEHHSHRFYRHSNPLWVEHVQRSHRFAILDCVKSFVVDFMCLHLVWLIIMRWILLSHALYPKAIASPADLWQPRQVGAQWIGSRLEVCLRTSVCGRLFADVCLRTSVCGRLFADCHSPEGFPGLLHERRVNVAKTQIHQAKQCPRQEPRILPPVSRHRGCLSLLHPCKGLAMLGSNGPLRS